jgi:hypothetical protein
VKEQIRLAMRPITKEPSNRVYSALSQSCLDIVFSTKDSEVSLKAQILFNSINGGSL